MPAVYWGYTLHKLRGQNIGGSSTNQYIHVHSKDTTKQTDTVPHISQRTQAEGPFKRTQTQHVENQSSNKTITFFYKSACALTNNKTVQWSTLSKIQFSSVSCRSAKHSHQFWFSCASLFSSSEPVYTKSIDRRMSKTAQAAAEFAANFLCAEHPKIKLVEFVSILLRENRINDDFKFIL